MAAYRDRPVRSRFLSDSQESIKICFDNAWIYFFLIKSHAIVVRHSFYLSPKAEEFSSPHCYARWLSCLDVATSSSKHSLHSSIFSTSWGSFLPSPWKLTSSQPKCAFLHNCHVPEKHFVKNTLLFLAESQPIFLFPAEPLSSMIDSPKSPFPDVFMGCLLWGATPMALYWTLCWWYGQDAWSVGMKEVQ